MSGKGCLLFVLGGILVIPCLVWSGMRIYHAIDFERKLEGHLKRAADANSISLAKQELEVAVKQMEAWGMTNGYTSIVYTTPDEDVGFWYQNVKSCLDQINSLPDGAQQGEKDLVLMKLRQSLLDHKGGHEAVTVPTGIGVFPNNANYCLFGWLSVVALIIGAIMMFVSFLD